MNAAVAQATPGPRPLLGIGLILLTCLCFAALDTTAKHVGALLPVLVMLWVRYAFQAVVMLAWLARPRHRALLRPAHPRFQAVRGLLLLSVSALGFFGLQFMPVAEFTSVVMLTPVLVTLLAAVFLREPVSRLRWALVAGGCLGALLIVRPGSGLFGWGALIAAALALCNASFQLLTSRLAGREHPLTTHFCTGMVGTVACTLLLLALPIELVGTLAAASPATLALALLIGLFGTVGHLLLILAMGQAPVSTLMPFTYAQIVFATLTGWLAFAHVPDGWAVVGMAVIAACGAAAVWLDSRQALARPRTR